LVVRVWFSGMAASEVESPPQAARAVPGEIR
jgi:hypothetical protein